MSPAVDITLTEVEGDPALEPMLQAIDAFNAPAAGPSGFHPVNLVVRRPGEAAPCGGLFGHTLYRWFFVRLLYLPADLRRGGLGATLLRRAEAEAVARGCIGIHLDTFSFQARPFYEKQGYRVFGTIPDYPPGAARHFLLKRLDGDSHVPT
jgi:GNAT superfamily N-acetyltransferase